MTNRFLTAALVYPRRKQEQLDTRSLDLRGTNPISTLESGTRLGRNYNVLAAFLLSMAATPVAQEDGISSERPMVKDDLTEALMIGRVMNPRRLSRCCETYGGHSQKHDASPDQSTTNSPTSVEFEKPPDPWQANKENRSSSEFPGRKDADIRDNNLLRMVLTQGCSSVEHLHGKQTTFGTTTTIESDNGSYRGRQSVASSFSRGKKTWRCFVSFLRFVGPGMVIAVAYGKPHPFYGRSDDWSLIG